MPKWILVAEDNPHDAEMTLLALNLGQSIDVIVASDGQETLDCLRRCGLFSDRVIEPPLLVLLDLKMPKINGFQVLEQMKADTKFKMIPVVIFSSSREQNDLLRAYKGGANGFVVKPLTFTDYSAALGAVRTYWMKVNEPPPSNGEERGEEFPSSGTAPARGAGHR